MRKTYKRDAYYLDNGILLYGYKDKYGFHPEHSLLCGFSRQVLSKRDVGRVLFYSLSDAISKIGEVELIGGKITLAIDNGFAATKIVYGTGDFKGQYKTETRVVEHNVKPVILECLNAAGIKAVRNVKVKYMLVSELPNRALLLASPLPLSRTELLKLEHEIIL